MGLVILTLLSSLVSNRGHLFSTRNQTMLNIQTTFLNDFPIFYQLYDNESIARPSGDLVCMYITHPTSSGQRRLQELKLDILIFCYGS